MFVCELQYLSTLSLISRLAASVDFIPQESSFSHCAQLDSTFFLVLGLVYLLSRFSFIAENLGHGVTGSSFKHAHPKMCHTTVNTFSARTSSMHNTFPEKKPCLRMRGEDVMPLAIAPGTYSRFKLFLCPSNPELLHRLE